MAEIKAGHSNGGLRDMTLGVRIFLVVHPM